ncbi:MAG: thioesterase family protein [Pseudomonadota bacterium]
MPADINIPRDRAAYDFFTPVTIRYSDQDPMQHVNNVAVAAYLEAGRLGFVEHMFAGKDTPANRMVLANLTIDYLREITFPGTVEVGGKMAALGERSLTTHYGIFQGEACMVVCRAVNVFFDPQTRRSAAPSPDDRAVLERFLHDV